MKMAIIKKITTSFLRNVDDNGVCTYCNTSLVSGEVDWVLVDIKNIEVIDVGKVIKIKCIVSKGTYIRSLIRDIGVKLETYATMTNLLRTKQGMFDIKTSYKLEDIKNGTYELIKVEEVFKDYPKIILDEDSYKKVSNGCVLDNKYDSAYVLFYYRDSLVSIYKSVENKKIKPFIMF